MLVEVLLARYDTKGENTMEKKKKKDTMHITGQSTEGHSDVAKWLNKYGPMSNLMKVIRSFAEEYIKDKPDATAKAAAAKKSKGKNKRAGGMISTKKTYAHGGGVRRPKR